MHSIYLFCWGVKMGEGGITIERITCHWYIDKSRKGECWLQLVCPSISYKKMNKKLKQCHIAQIRSFPAHTRDLIKLVFFLSYFPSENKCFNTIKYWVLQREKRKYFMLLLQNDPKLFLIRFDEKRLRQSIGKSWLNHK